MNDLDPGVKTQRKDVTITNMCCRPGGQTTDEKDVNMCCRPGGQIPDEHGNNLIAKSLADMNSNFLPYCRSHVFRIDLVGVDIHHLGDSYRHDDSSCNQMHMNVPRAAEVDHWLGHLSFGVSASNCLQHHSL